MEDRFITSTENNDEDRHDRAIRPVSLNDYIGQPVV